LNTWCIAGFLQAHSEINQVHHDLCMTLRLHGAAHQAEADPWFAVLRDEGGDYRVEWALAWFGAIWMAWFKHEMFATGLKEKNEKTVEVMHNLKEQAHQMRDSLLKGELNKIGEILHFGWQNKKQMAHSISNTLIDDIYSMALKSGASGGKISGAGGGGFMFFYCPAVTKVKVANALESLGGRVQPFKFTQQGLTTWTIN